MKWLVTAGVVALGLAFLWQTGVLRDVGGAFQAWLHWIGSR